MSGGWPPMSRRALRCSSPRSVGESRNPDQYNSSGSQSNGLMTPVVLGWPLINGSPGRNILIRQERKRHRGWDLSWTEEAVSPSWMVFYFISSSSVPWWTTRVPSGGSPLAAISRNCRCCSPSVFALLPTHPGTLVTDKLTMLRFLWPCIVSKLWSAHTLQGSAPQPLPTTSNRSSAAQHMQ